jgi:hypothetical protein
MHVVHSDLDLLVALSILAVAGNAACIVFYLALRPDGPPALRRLRRWMRSFPDREQRPS